MCIAPSGEIEDSVRYDVLVANILSGTLIELGPVLHGLMCPGARMAITGILADQAEQVCSAWSGWANKAVASQVNNWVLLAGNKHEADTDSDGTDARH